MTDEREFLGREPINRLLFKLAVPTVAAQLINMLYNIVDRIYIGHMPENGSLALTGVGVCLPVIMIVSAFAALVSSGEGSLYGRTGCGYHSCNFHRDPFLCSIQKSPEKYAGKCKMRQALCQLHRNPNCIGKGRYEMRK